MKHLMIFSIGPVQDFIATARRSRDLWYGSWMLSELARVAAKEISSKPDSELIFPAKTDIISIPNKIVAKVTAADSKTFAKEVEDVVRDYLKRELAEKTLASIPLTETNKQLAIRQIDDLLELYWVSVPYENRDYSVVRAEAEALLVARKATRDFKQMLGANVPKSSLDGSRESVIDEKEYPDNKKDSDDEKANKVRKLYDIYNARQGERLSGVDLLKRLGEKNNKDRDNKKIQPDFKSTSHMAAIPFMEKLGKTKTAKLIKDIQSVFISKKWDIGEKDDVPLLYESRLTDWIPAGKDQDEIREAFNKKWKENELGESRPSPYYALLRADGDNMGKVIDGQTEEEQHRKLSEALSGFAEEVSSIINNKKDDETNNKGLLIYSGGDDVLAYLPINKALRCAKELEDEFRKRLSKFAFTKDKDKESDKDNHKETIEPTLSVGIVIAHHLDPLSDVLKMAGDAEHKAKDDVKGKNGLAVTLSKRSGTDRTVVGKFAELYNRLNEIIDLTQQKVISGGTAYELQELEQVLPDNFSLEGLKAEAIRIVKHKQSADGEKISDKDKEKYLKTVSGWLENISAVKQKSKFYSLHDVANEMIIAKSLADGAKPSSGLEKEAQK